MAIRASDVSIWNPTELRNVETDAQRRARHGYDPLVACSFCGDTGTNPDTQSECHCIIGTQLEERYARELMWAGLIPRRMQNFSLEHHPNRKLAQEVGEWIDSKPCRTGENLVIQGGVGTGKTGAAIGALRELHFQGATVVYWFLPDLMDQLRADEFGRSDDLRKRPTMAYLTECDMLLLDDMGTERSTDYVKDRMHTIFDNRYSSLRPTILTTNYDGDQWKNYLGNRIYSRFNQNVRYLKSTGPDLRGRKK